MRRPRSSGRAIVKRLDVARRFGYITVGLGMVTMTLMGVVMYLCAPWVMELMTPVERFSRSV